MMSRVTDGDQVIWYEVDWGSSEDLDVYLNGMLANLEGVFLHTSVTHV